MGTDEPGVSQSQPDSGRQKPNPGTRYTDPKITKRQYIEGFVLSFVLLVFVGLTFSLWHFPDKQWSWTILAGVAGIIGGLLHSLKWFYRTIATGEWEWDQVWWRFMNPLVSGVMGLSIYVVFRSGFEAKATNGLGGAGTEGFYAYSIGFLTGLFADNAMGKLRDIAYTLFGPTERPATKPKGANPNDQNEEPRPNG
jgi:hypothetical protein